jgi:hypothetical protein
MVIDGFRTAPQNGGTSTSNLDTTQIDSQLYSESLFGDIDLNNISLDWSWFDIDFEPRIS